MPLRVSGYLIATRLSDSRFFLLLHGYTGAFDKVSADVGQALLSRRSQEIEASDLPEHLVPKLIERGYLTSLSADGETEEFRQIAATIHQAGLVNHSTAFVIIPTYMCNLRCSYCWQSTDMHIGRGQYSAMLDLDRIEHLFTIIDQFRDRGSYVQTLRKDVAPEEHAGNGSARRITLFGGEPLLAIARSPIKQILDHARRREMRVDAITNGVELDSYADLLGPGLIEGVQITLDGPPDAHDRRRIGPEYRTTFDRIAANISLALDCGVQVMMRINVDQRNVSDFSELERFFIDRGWKQYPNFFVQAATVHTGSSRPSEARHLIPSSTLVQITTSAADRGDTCIESYEYAARQIVKTLIGSKEYPFRRTSFCSAEAGMLIFDPLGDVYSCWEDAGDSRYRTGTYDADGIRFIDSVANEWLARFPGAIAECSICPYGLIHVSGCASEARRDTGGLFAPSCQSFQDYFPMTLARVYEEFERELLDAPIGRVFSSGTAV